MPAAHLDQKDWFRHVMQSISFQCSGAFDFQFGFRISDKHFSFFLYLFCLNNLKLFVARYQGFGVGDLFCTFFFYLNPDFFVARYQGWEPTG